MKIESSIDFLFHGNMTCWSERGVAVKTELQYGDAHAGNFVLVCVDSFYQGLIRMLFCHCVGGVEMAFDQAGTADGLVCDLLSAVVHDFGLAGGRRAHRVLPQCFVVNVQDSWHLLLQKLKHESALIAKSGKSNVKR